MLHTPRNVRNVDGMPNKAGKITEAVDLVLDHRGTKETHVFFVVDIGPDDFIFGYPFLEANTPKVNWVNVSLEDSTTASTLDANQCRICPKGKGQRRKVPLWVRSLPDWAPGNEVWRRITLQKTTVAQQLAVDALEGKEEKTWQELVPKRYHRYAKVFNEKDSEKSPDRRLWDHTIDLKEDAPTSINCRVYPLSPKEREEQRKFLATNLQLKRIHCSKSPYASGFFFIRKKDRKL